jgi:hypothetical protein
MKNSRLTGTAVTIIFGLNFSAVAASAVTVKKNLINDELSSHTGISFQSFCLDTNERLSFGDIHIVDASDVTLKGDLDNPTSDSLDSETACCLQKGVWNLNGHTSNIHLPNMYENPSLVEDHSARVVTIPASGAVPLMGFGMGLFRWLRRFLRSLQWLQDTRS